MRERDQRFDSGDETNSLSSPCTSTSFSSEETTREKQSVRKHGSFKRKRSISVTREKEDTSRTSSSPSSSDSSDVDTKRRKSKSHEKERRNSHRKDRLDRENEKKKERKRRSKRSDERQAQKEKQRRKEKHEREKRKKRVSGSDSIAGKEEVRLQPAKSTLQAMNEAQMQQKELVRRNVEMAKARLASGELQRMKQDQMEMQRLYGTVDWREKKKLRAEKSRLERTIAAGQKLANIEERENARMDAFRVALGLPTAEAQRQAEWRAEATRALAEAEAANKDNLSPSVNLVPSRTRKVIGPRLPH